MHPVLVPCLALLAMQLPGSVVWAHGDTQHPRPAVAIPAEQKDWGIAGNPNQARRRVEVTMSDAMRFTPSAISVRQGETVRFVIRNRGRLMHEFVLGTRQELQTHAALMAKFPDMAHDEPYMAHVAPGKTGEIVWTFNRPGDFEFACLIAGHFQAGMVGSITVTAR